MNIVIEEFVNVDETFQSIKNIKVGSMTLNDLFGDNLKVIEKALEERKKLLKWKDSQQDLIKGKDEHIAKLCCDRAELKEQVSNLQSLIASMCDYVGLDNLAPYNDLEQIDKEFREYADKMAITRIDNIELSDLREFAKIVATKGVDSLQAKSCKDDYDYNNWIDIGEYAILSKREFYLVKKVVEKYEIYKSR